MKYFMSIVVFMLMSLSLFAQSGKLVIVKSSNFPFKIYSFQDFQNSRNAGYYTESNILYVSNSGNDVTGIPNNVAKPFKSALHAYKYSEDNDVIVLEYSEGLTERQLYKLPEFQEFVQFHGIDVD